MLLSDVEGIRREQDSPFGFRALRGVGIQLGRKSWREWVREDEFLQRFRQGA